MVSTSVNGTPVVVQLIGREANGSLRIRYKGTATQVGILPASAARLEHIMPIKAVVDNAKVVLSPMPGVVKQIMVQVGDLVGEGQECAVVEVTPF